MEQWNVRPPPLYLWSRPDWTGKHKIIAQEHGHLFSQHEVSKMEGFDNEKSSASHTMELDDNYGDDIMLGRDFLMSLDDEDRPSMNEGQIESSSHGTNERESQAQAENTSSTRKRTEGNDGRGPAVASPAKRQAINEMPEGKLDHNVFNPLDGRPSVEVFQPISDMIPPDIEAGDHGYGHLEPNSSSRMEFGAAYDGTQQWPSVANPRSDYGMEEHHSRLLGDRTNSLGYRPPYIREDDRYPRELETRQQIYHHGLQNPDPMRSSNYISGHDPAYSHMGSSYSVRGPGYEPSFMIDTPAMQRYAPRFDELNHVRMDSLGSEPPIIGRSGTSERSVPQPQPGYGNGLPMPGSAAGRHHLYSRQNLAGWFGY